MINLKKLMLLIAVVLVFAGYDFLFLERFENVRVFNIIAEFFFAAMAAILFLSIDDLKGRRFYHYINVGFFLAFVAMLIDGLDQLHFHGELYTALGEKLTQMVAFTLIIIGVKNWIVEFSSMNSRLEELVITDDLTGLYNRRGLIKIFAELEEKARKEHLSLSFVIADLDDFKEYNDTMGHLAGDELLHSLGQKFKELTNASQIIGRWGGEEFAVGLLGSDMVGAKAFAERIRKQVLSINLPRSHDGSPLTVSLGVAQLLPGEDLMNAVKRADRSLYRAKSNGKNQVFALPEPIQAVG
ncbi:GGDEF domain-containing protein [Marinicella sediminis]|uniref:diguanylate cyclase n=1 Tax=Marinicella sediminis TaxID=1792834 RepID=A0ABV7JBM2_9GAMM|nr:GGDEF domain-containing protein [Marinicella sediminis]